nr:isoform 6 of synaptojanin-1 [Quercus suber]
MGQTTLPCANVETANFHEARTSESITCGTHPAPRLYVKLLRGAAESSEPDPMTGARDISSAHPNDSHDDRSYSRRSSPASTSTSIGRPWQWIYYCSGEHRHRHFRDLVYRSIIMSRSRASTSSARSLMQDVPDPHIDRLSGQDADDAPVSLSQAVYARRAEYVVAKNVRIKIGTWNVAGYKGTENDIGGWFVDGKGVTEALAGLKINGDLDRTDLDGREGTAAQEERYAKKQSTIPRNDPGSLPGAEDVGLYALALQEVVDIGSVTEALRPYTDPTVAKRWKDSMSEALPAGYELVAEQQLLGLLLLVYAAPEIAKEVRAVSTTSVGTGLGGYMGNKGAVAVRLVLGETTRLVFVNSHLAAGTDKAALDRRNWDAQQVVARIRFDPIRGIMDLNQATGEQIGDEDFAFWVGDLNYRLEGIPGEDVRRLLMLHTRNEYDLSEASANKIEKELANATEAAKKRTEDRYSIGSTSSGSMTSSTSSTHRRNSSDTTQTAPSIVDEIAASEDPASLQATLSSLLPHDELQQQMKAGKAFHDGWREGDIRFLPTYKYDPGSVGVFDSSDKKRGPSWCDRILFRTRRDKLAYEASVRDQAEARKKDEAMKADGTDLAANDEEILYDYDPENDAADEYDEYDDAELGAVVTKEGFEDQIGLEYYAAHQRVLSSDHKPLDAVFMLKYDAVVPEKKAKIYAEVAKELDKAENEGRPDVTVVVDKHRPGDAETSDEDASRFEGVWFGDVKWAQAKHRTLTIANTSRVAAGFTFIERPVDTHQAVGIAPSWLNVKVNDEAVSSSAANSPLVHLEPGDSATIELELRIFDVHLVSELNEGARSLEDTLVLRVEDGRDHFIPIRGSWLQSSLTRSIDKLIRIPEGGIRKLQRQCPDGGQSRPSSSTAVVSEDDPVRFSAPRELFKLTEAIEELSIRVIAEWDMIHPADTDATRAPWIEHHAWPFEKESWSEQETVLFQTGLSAVCDALDEDSSIQQNLPPELPRMQRLYVLAHFMLLFLKSMPDGIITEQLWAQIEAHTIELERSKRKLTPDEEKTAIEEILAQTPSHNIAFILITSMLSRIMQEFSTAASETEAVNKALVDDMPMSPTRKAAGTLRRITHLGKSGGVVPEMPVQQQAAGAFAKVLANVIIRSSTQGGEKAKATTEKRKQQILERFLRSEVLAVSG